MPGPEAQQVGSWRPRRGAAAAAKAGAEGGAGRRTKARREKGEAGHEELLTKALIALSKLTLQQESSAREIGHVTCECWLGPLAAKPMQSAIKAGADYNATVQELRKGHGLGPPHLCIALTFMEDLKDLAIAPHRAVLEQVLKLVDHPQGQKRMGEIVKRCRVKACYHADDVEEKDKKAVMMISFNPFMDMASVAEDIMEEGLPSVIQIRRAVDATMKRELCDRVEGPAPKGELPRQVERNLRALLGKAAVEG